MKYLFVFFLAGMTFTSFGQRNEVHFYDSGSINYEYSYNEEGNREGIQRQWHENGVLKEKIEFTDGVKDGFWRTWFNNGQMRYESHWNEYGEIDGLKKRWYENGQLQSEENYKDGEINGLWRAWHENGQLKSEGNVKEGVQISKKCYDENGNKIICD